MRKKISAKELGAACNVTESAISYYELGDRQVNKDILHKIAQHMSVPEAALRDRNIYDYVDVMHVLFELSEKCDLIPYKIPEDTRFVLATEDKTMQDAIYAWFIKHNELKQREISEEEYDDWKTAFPLQCEFIPISEIGYVYDDRARAIRYRSLLNDILQIVSTQCEEIRNYLTTKKGVDEARVRLSNLENTLATIIRLDLDRIG